MNSLSSDLRLYAWLLGTPAADAKTAIAEQAAVHPWLAEPAAELQALALDEWQAEHTRLFVSGYPKTPCPPFASAYLEGAMHGQSRADLANIYAQLGMAATGAPADYLGTILDFAAHLLAQGQAAGEAWETLSGRYMDRWIPRFCDDLQAHANLLLYRQTAARLAACFPLGIAADD